MKTTKFKKRLVLNKKTISNMDDREMKNLVGGVLITYTCTCITTDGNPESRPCCAAC